MNDNALCKHCGKTIWQYAAYEGQPIDWRHYDNEFRRCDVRLPAVAEPAGVSA